MRIVMVAGGAAVGKTAVLKSALPPLCESGLSPCVCKIDCLHTDDGARYRSIGVACAVGLSDDVCPDHYLVSNLPELWSWTQSLQNDLLLIETAGLCHRCSPATQLVTSICVLDCTSSCRSPQQLGPLLTLADAIVLTKGDMVSQAEREILIHLIGRLNARARLFVVDGLSGYGVEPLVRFICNTPDIDSLEGDYLRFNMPSGVCSYCVGERRIGSAFQQGVVGKICFGDI